MVENNQITAKQVGQLSKTTDFIAKLIDLHGKSEDREANIKRKRKRIKHPRSNDVALGLEGINRVSSS